MMKRYALFIFFLLSGPIFFINAAYSAEIVDRIVAIVNDDIIRLRELDRAAAPIEKEIISKHYDYDREKEEIYQVRMKVLNNLVDEKLADQEIRESGIYVDEREVDSAIEQVKAMNYYTDEDLRAALSASNMSMEEYRENIKQQLLRNKLVQIKVKSKIIITDSDIEKYYHQHPEKYGAKIKYLLRNIVVSDPDGRDRIQRVYDELKTGLSFEKAAQQYSEAVNAKDAGSLGFFSPDDLAQNIRDAIIHLHPGEFSEITETDQGYQIFYVEKIEEKAGRSLAEVTDEIRQQLYEEAVNEKFQAWIDQLRKEALIKIVR